MKTLTPIRAMRAKCLDCSAGSKHEVTHCPVTCCALWPYRLGKRPKKEMACMPGCNQPEPNRNDAATPTR